MLTNFAHWYNRLSLISASGRCAHARFRLVVLFKAGALPAAASTPHAWFPQCQEESSSRNSLMVQRWSIAASRTMHALREVSRGYSLKLVPQNAQPRI
jgi:hypothetical protein